MKMFTIGQLYRIKLNECGWPWAGFDVITRQVVCINTSNIVLCLGIERSDEISRIDIDALYDSKRIIISNAQMVLIDI